MAESENGKVSGEAQEPENQARPEDSVPVQNPPQNKPETSATDTTVPPASHGKLWLVLLLIIAALPLGWFLLPENTRRGWTDALITSLQKPIHARMVPSPPTVSPEPVAPKAPPAVSAQTPAPPVALPKPSRIFNEKIKNPAITSEESKALMSAIHNLQSNIETFQESQADLRHALHARQQLELRARLRWIASSQTLLPQMASFWQDIALLPMLNTNDRNEAKTMQRLAADDATKLAGWSQQLKRLAATLPVPQHQDIIPKPKNPAFSWLTGKFHLRPVPMPEQQNLLGLRVRLLNTAHVLAIEIWPQPKTWRHLLADLREQFGDDADLALPEHLDNIRKDIKTMRVKAANWLEKL